MAATDTKQRADESIVQWLTNDQQIQQRFQQQQQNQNLRQVNQAFGSLAQDIVNKLPRNHERTNALQRLVEAQDAVIRASVFDDANR